MSDTIPQASGTVTDGIIPSRTTSGGVPAIASAQSGTGQHGLSPKVSVTLVIAISVVITIALILAVILCMHRRRRRRGGAVPAGTFNDVKVVASDENAAWARKDEQQRGAVNGDLAIVSAHPLGSSALAPNRPSAFATSDSAVFSPGTSHHFSQSESGDSTRPLLYRIMSDGCTMDTVGEGALSLPGTSSTQYGSEIWSRNGIVGEDSQAQGGTLDIRHTGRPELGISGQSAPEHGVTVPARTNNSDIRDDEKRATIPSLGDDGPEGTSHTSLPVIPASPLTPTAQPGGSAAFPARLSSGPRGPRFVTVLMEVREDDLEEQDQPPPYQPRSYSRSQEHGTEPVSAVGMVEDSYSP